MASPLEQRRFRHAGSSGRLDGVVAERDRPARVRGDDDAPAAADIVADVIAFAEPVESTCAGLEPNLVRVEFSDDAMAEAMREMAEPYDDDAEE
jgi:hypothetical protein